MTEANPYARLLGEKNCFTVVRETPRRLRELVDRLGTQGLERSLGPGKWAARSIVSHLADGEIAFGYRLRQALTVDDYEAQAWDQEKWARPYDTIPAQQALEVFTALRGWNLALIKTLTPEDLDRKTTHPKRGAMTMRTVIETMAGHDMNHLLQLEKIAQR